jgi:hypothetical protein
MTQARREPASPLVLEAVAGASAAVAVALIARKTHAMRRRRGESEARRPDGYPEGTIGKLVEFALLRLAFRSILHGVRFTGRRLVARAGPPRNLRGRDPAVQYRGRTP